MSRIWLQYRKLIYYLCHHSKQLMIFSMTGFGKSVLQLPTKKVTIEVKSLNSKNLDLNTRMPSIYREKELEIRKYIANKLVRGKIDFSLYVENTGERTSSQVNTTVVKQYMEQLSKVSDGSEVEFLQMAVRMPDAVITEREDIDEDEWSKIFEEARTAISALQQYRTQEGEALEEDFSNRCKELVNLLQQVKDIDPERITSVRDRLQKAIDDIKDKYDENRFEQELIFYLEKYDITEEIVRLNNHLDYFKQNLNSSNSNGKKLGFICQEIGREINTIGSKANYAPMQKLVVQMKDELEKIKEQLLNVL